MTRAGILTGLIIATGLVLILTSLIRTRPRLSETLGRLTPPTPGTATEDAGSSDVEDPTGFKLTLGRLAASWASALNLTAPEKDLQLIGRTTSWYWAEKASASLVGFMFPIILAAANVAFGSPLPLTIPLIASIGFGAYFWFLPDLQIKARAKAAREQFTRAAVAYLQLMAIHRNAGASPIGAMRDAAEISDQWMFVRIREEISRAALAGVSAWDGVAQLGDRTGITALTEVGDIMRLAGTPGGAVSPALLGRARGMRNKILSEEHASTLARTNTMQFPILLTAVLIGMTIGIPAIAQFLTI